MNDNVQLVSLDWGGDRPDAFYVYGHVDDATAKAAVMEDEGDLRDDGTGATLMAMLGPIKHKYAGWEYPDEDEEGNPFFEFTSDGPNRFPITKVPVTGWKKLEAEDA
jgi:hypothetical protein